MVAVSAHKLGGPPGIGAPILKDERLIEAAGGQERGLRGGTENLPAIMGFAAAGEAIGGWADATLPLQQRLETGVREAGGALIAAAADREGKRVVEGKGGSVRVDTGGRRVLKKKKIKR